MLRTVCAQVSMVYSIKEMLVFLHPRKTKLCCLSTSRHFFSRLHTSFGFKIIVIQSPSWVWLFVTTWTAARQASLSFTISQLKLMSIELVMPSNHLILVTPFSSCPKSFPVSESFPVSQLFESGGQSIEALASVLPMNIQGRFPLRLTGLVSLLSKELSRVFSNTTVGKRHSLALSFLYGPTLTSIHDYVSFTILLKWLLKHILLQSFICSKTYVCIYIHIVHGICCITYLLVEFLIQEKYIGNYFMEWKLAL